MATFSIRQQHEPSSHKNVIDINIRAKKHKNWLKISIIFNIAFIVYFIYLNFNNKF